MSWDLAGISVLFSPCAARNPCGKGVGERPRTGRVFVAGYMKTGLMLTLPQLQGDF